MLARIKAIIDRLLETTVVVLILSLTAVVVIAVIYRLFIIKPALNHYMKRYFAPGEPVLHAGCGGGQVDVDVVKRLNVTALDNSPVALER